MATQKQIDFKKKMLAKGKPEYAEGFYTWIEIVFNYVVCGLGGIAIAFFLGDWCIWFVVIMFILGLLLDI